MKGTIKDIMGTILIFLRPKRARELSKNGMTILDAKRFSKLDFLMRDALLKKAERSGNFETLAAFQQAYWVNQGHDFFSRNDDSFEQAFLPDCAFLFEELKEHLSSRSDRFDTLVEIGTGNGKVLDYLSREFPKIKSLIGIDLSSVQIDMNKENHKKNSRLRFVSADAFEWVSANAHSHTIFVTSRGVLEYFTEQRLQDFLHKLNGLGKTIFVAIEPNGVDHDFAINPGSRPYGHERSFSHNYAAMFEKAGFTLWHNSKKDLSRNDFYFTFIGAKN